MPVTPERVAVPADTSGGRQVSGRASEAERRQLKRELEQLGRGEVEGGRKWERSKNPRLAMLSSAFLPGLGQVYNGRRLKVAVMLGFVAYYGGNMVLNWKQHKYYEARHQLLPENSKAWRDANILSEFHKETAIDFLWWSGAVWLVGVLDAWIDAHLYDVRRYEPSISARSNPEAPVPRIGLGAGSDGQRYVTFSIGF